MPSEGRAGLEVVAAKLDVTRGAYARAKAARLRRPRPTLDEPSAAMRVISIGLRQRCNALAAGRAGLGAEAEASSSGGAEGSRKRAISFSGGISPELNKKIRQGILHQHRWTNAFTGSPLAAHAEALYQRSVGQYQRAKVRLRCLALGILFVVATLYENIANTQSAAFVALRTAVPAALTLALSAAIGAPALDEAWPRAVVLVAPLAYASFAAAWLLADVDDWSPAQRDYNAMWELVWQIIALLISALLLGLDMTHVLVVLVTEWASYVAVALGSFARWRATSDHHSWRFSPREDDEGARDASTHTLVDSLVVSSVVLVLVLMAMRRLNRFERQCFVNAYVLQYKVQTQTEKLSGKAVELLALFSNPRPPPNSPLQLRPLQLGQELKHLLKAVPPVYIAVEPAAGISDVCAAIDAHSPRMVLFSGHSFMGSLAFELPNGRIDLPPAEHFIQALARAPRLSCVFLNGCRTAALAYRIVETLGSSAPGLRVICWASITEDTAARAFAQGFYDAVGQSKALDEEVHVESAYWAGLERMHAEGFALGDPESYLHPPGHPHHAAPQLYGCPGCCPPVHGLVVMLRSAGGAVQLLTGGADDERAGPPAQRSSERRTSERSMSDASSAFGDSLADALAPRLGASQYGGGRGGGLGASSLAASALVKCRWAAVRLDEDARTSTASLALIESDVSDVSTRPRARPPRLGPIGQSILRLRGSASRGLHTPGRAARSRSLTASRSPAGGASGCPACSSSLGASACADSCPPCACAPALLPLEPILSCESPGNPRTDPPTTGDTDRV